MARPREFDLDTVLDRATQVFWTQGYEHTSVDQLCDATGLGRSSLYGAFRHKRGLYVESLARYEEGSVARIRESLAGKPVREGLRTFLDGLVASIVAGPGRRGCFIGNCAAELARLDRVAASRVRRSLARIEAEFLAILEAARDRKEIAKDADTVAMARFITAGIQGLRLVGKANPDRKALEDVAAMMLRCLDN
jgi:TetR/AcrR family transcriptional repressor of nem operon